MVLSRTIESAYAGGEKGREVIDAILPNVHVRKKDVCDVVHSEREWSVLFAVERANIPEEVSSILKATGLEGEVAHGRLYECRSCCRSSAGEKN